MLKGRVNKGRIVAVLSAAATLTSCGFEDYVHYHRRQAIEQREAEAAANDQRGAVLGGALGPQESGRYEANCREAETREERLACGDSDYYYDSEGKRRYYRERY